MFNAKLKQFLVMAGLMIGALLLLQAGPTAFAQTSDTGLNDFCPPVLKVLNGCQQDIKGVVLLIVNFFLGFLALLATVMIIYAGFLYVGSAGNEEAVGKAKKILIWAGIGIVLILVAVALVNTLLRAAGGQA